ncbi:MAG: hypothetical protein V7709_14170 [Halioglobus sp.]
MSGFHLSLLAFLLVFATGFRWFQLVYAVALPKNRLGFLLFMVLGAGLALVALVQGAGVFGSVLASLAVFLGCFFIFAWSISAQKGGTGTLQIGSKLQSFSATDHRGDIFESASLEGRPVLLKFFRGHW